MQLLWSSFHEPKMGISWHVHWFLGKRETSGFNSNWIGIYRINWMLVLVWCHDFSHVSFPSWDDSCNWNWQGWNCQPISDVMLLFPRGLWQFLKCFRCFFMGFHDSLIGKQHHVVSCKAFVQTDPCQRPTGQHQKNKFVWECAFQHRPFYPLVGR